MTKKISHIIFVTVILLITTLTSTSQTGLITFSSVEGCQGDIIEIPVNAYNLNNIGAITLYIDYNPDIIEFDTLININSSLPGLLYNDIEQTQGTIPGGKIGVSWSGFNPATISNNELFVLSFLYHGQNDSIVFSANNEIADFDANILTVNYSNSTITLSEEVSITQQPYDLNIMINESGNFLVDGININEFNWEYKINGIWTSIQNSSMFSGQNTNTLSINSPEVSLNEIYFKCQIIGCNSMYSDSVQLFVQPNGFENIIGNTFISVYPNPAKYFINIEFIGINNGKYSLELFNPLSGKSIIIQKDIIIQEEKNITIDTKQFASGIYFIILKNLSGNKRIQFTQKILIHK